MGPGDREPDRDEKTRSFVAKAITIVGLTPFLLAGVHAALSGNEAEFRAATVPITALLGFVLGYYFKSRRG
jgi:hypothetical protein